MICPSKIRAPLSQGWPCTYAMWCCPPSVSPRYQRKWWIYLEKVGLHLPELEIGDLRIYHTEKLEYHDIVISSMDGFCMVLVGTPIFGNAHLTVVPFFRFLSFQCRFLKKSIRIVFLHLLSCILTWPMAVWRIPMFNNRADVHMEFVNGHVEFPIDI